VNRAGAIATLGALVLPATSAVPVLMYHTVNETVPHNPVALSLTLPTQRFADQLRYLAAHRIATLTAGGLVEALAREERPRGVVLTFDDGYADMARTVAPLLARYRMRATFFVNSGSIGTHNHLTWRELRALHAAGNEIGAHGAHHLDLTTLDRAGQVREIGGCIAKLEQYARVRPVSYCYASGEYNATTLALLPTFGIRSAWTERNGRVHDLSRPYELPRLRIARETTLEQFAALVS